MTRYRHYRMV